MKTPRLHYFKKNTAELPEGYRKPVKRRRKTAVEPPPIVVAKPVIRRVTPRGRLMPLRMKNEYIPPGVDWCQINGQKVRQDIYFGDVRGRMFIPGMMSGEGCEGACTPSMVDFGGGCGCEGCDSGCEGCASSSCADSSCADSGCGETGCAVDGCAGCGSDTGCETAGCAETGCTTTSDTGCSDSGCVQAACAETGCTTTSDTGCDTGCSVSCADSGCDSGCTTSGCGGCEGCISCADTGCTGCADTGCSMAPTGGVDFTGGGMGFGYGPGPAGNMGFGNAMGPPGWATGDFGAYGFGGPTSTGFGPGAQGASIGGPSVYAAAPGINGFEGDFGAPPGGAFGMPNQGDVGPQAGPGMPGGPSTVGNAEPGFMPAGPEVQSPDVAPTRGDDRTEVDPTTVFGPEFATNQAAPTAGWFGPSQAQAASRGTDTDAMLLQSDPFAQVAQMAQTVAQTNPALAEALMGIAANQNNQTNMVGPMMTGFEQASPGAQQGFTGTSAQQGTMSFDSFGGKGDSLNQSGRADTQQVNPNMDLIGPMVTQQGYQQLAAEMNAQQPQAPTVQGPLGPTPAETQQGYQQLAAEMNARQNQQDMVTAQELGEQGKGAPIAQMSPQQTISNAFEALTAANQQQAAQQAAPFDAQARGEQGRGPDSFDSRFGDPSQFMPSAPTLSVDALDAQSRGEQGKGDQLAPWAQTETIGLRPGEDVISSLNPFTLGVGREAAPLGLWGMSQQDTGRPGGSPPGMPSTGPFGPPGGRPGSETSGRPGLSLTVGNNQYAAGRPGGGQQGGGRPGGYYQTGGAGIAPGARGAEFGGMYGAGVATGRAGTNTFGVSSREGAYGFYDPATGLYYR